MAGPNLLERAESAIDSYKGLPPGPPRAPQDLRRESEDRLLKHVRATYRLLRIGMGWLALVYPAFLVVVGVALFDVPWQPSISDYYYALPASLPLPAECLVAGAQRSCADAWTVKAVELSFPMRSFFCGGLISIGFFLILYQGFSWLENVALNLAGLFAIGVAIFPMNKIPYGSAWPTWAHFLCAIALFVCMWFVSRFCAKDTLIFFGDDRAKVAAYEARYRRISWAMAAVIGAGLIYFVARRTLDALFPWTLFVIEAVGVAIFASYWMMKSREIEQHQVKAPQ
jgi:hypothetical protein